MARLVTCLIFILFSLCFIISSAQNDSTTTSRTTIAQPTPESRQNSNEEDPESAEVIQEKSHCTCDLTVQGCDVDCCCDPDCRYDDRSVFSCCCLDTCDTDDTSQYCEDIYSSVDDSMCVKERVVYMENTPYTVTETSGGLFCVYTDNYEERNHYETPAMIVESDEFDQYLEEYGTPSYKPDSTDSSGPNVTQPYQSGDALYTVYEGDVMGLLGLPAPLTSQTCVDSNPAAFLYNEHHECVRLVADLTVTCDGQSTDSLVFDAKTYYKHFRIVSSPTDLKTDSQNVTTEEETSDPSSTVSVTDAPSDDTVPSLYDISVQIDANGTHICVDELGLNNTCSFDADLPSPQLQGDVCTNMVIKVVYDIEHNATDGVTAASVTFTLANISTTATSLQQEFQATYTKLGEDETIEVSGRPGYHVEEPVLAGELTGPNADNLYTITVPGNRDHMLTIVKSSMDGQCVNATSNRETVTFGVDMRSGCYVKVSYDQLTDDTQDVCELLQDLALDALLGPEPRPTHIGTFGDSNSTVTGDWVEIIKDDPSNPTPGDGGSCGQLVLGMHIEILYANVGDLSNPQPKIIGTKYVYTRRDLTFQCVGGYCMPGTGDEDQMFEVISSVGFVDVSSPVVGVSAEQPTISARLPEDFFYPFS